MSPPDEKFTDLIRKIMPFCEVLGLSVVSATPQRVEATADWAEERTTVFGGLHGGYIMAIADSVGALCASQNLPEGAGTSTIESTIGRAHVRTPATPQPPTPSSA